MLSRLEWGRAGTPKQRDTQGARWCFMRCLCGDGGAGTRPPSGAQPSEVPADRAAATPATSSTITPCTPSENWRRTQSGLSLAEP